MHIVWINNHAANLGGCERYILDTVRLLKNRGIHSSLLYDPNTKVEVSYLKAFEQAYPLVSVQEQLKKLKADLVYLHQLPPHLKLDQLISQELPVLRFFHDNQLFCLREHKYTTLTKKTCFRPIGLHCYPCLGFINRSSGFPGLRLKFLPELKQKQKQNQRLQAFIVGSQYMAEQLKAHHFEPSKIHITPLYALPENSLIDTSWPQDFSLLYVGQLTTGKGLDILLKALSLLKSKIPLTVIGEGRQSETLKHMANELGLKSSVTFTGQLAPERLSAYYAQASCIVYPARRPESFGLVGIEAMQHARPVVASNIGAVPEWLQDGLTGQVFESGNTQQLADILLELQSNPEKCRQMGLQGQENYQDQYRPEKHIERLIKIFQSFIPGADSYVI